MGSCCRSFGIGSVIPAHAGVEGKGLNPPISSCRVPLRYGGVEKLKLEPVSAGKTVIPARCGGGVEDKEGEYHQPCCSEPRVMQGLKEAMVTENDPDHAFPAVRGLKA